MSIEMIDVRELIEGFSHEEHSKRANAYFASIRLDSPVARKPFASPGEAASLVGGLSPVLSGLRLFHGVRVLDFGAGTCWLSRILATLGCDVTAADVSTNALDLGRKIIEGDALSSMLKVRYAAFDGLDLPFPAKSFDRVVVFDAFHHCPDQRRMIREFHRILDDDGIAVFHEPGPNHSRSDQSQYEMRRFGVIEGNIVVEELFAEAKEAGFSDAELALYLERPLVVNMEQHDEFLANSGGPVGQWLAAHVQAECQGRRVFMLYKGRAKMRDSRASDGLLASLDLSAEIKDGEVHLSGNATNTGDSRWLPSNGGVGSVNLGVHLEDAKGRMINHDYARVILSTTSVQPGETCTIAGSMPLPEYDSFRLTIDLVAEGITWFEIGGTQVVMFAVDGLSESVERAS